MVSISSSVTIFYKTRFYCTRTTKALFVSVFVFRSVQGDYTYAISKNVPTSHVSAHLSCGVFGWGRRGYHIGILHMYEGGIEKSVLGITIWHHKAFTKITGGAVVELCL